MSFRFTQALIERSYSYADYTSLIKELLAEGKTTGDVQNSNMLGLYPAQCRTQ